MTSDTPEKLNEKIKSLFWECAKHKSELHKSFEVLLERDVQIASLESQLRDKDRIIAEYHSLILPLHEWAHNNAAFKSGESITKRILEMAKSSVDKDKEIERLKEALKNILALYSGGFSLNDNIIFLAKCRKLIE